MKSFAFLITSLLVVNMQHADLKTSSMRARLHSSVSNSSRSLFVGINRSDILIWERPFSKQPVTVRTGVFATKHLDLSQKGDLVVVAGSGTSQVEVWNISNSKKPKLASSLDHKLTVIYGLAISPDGRYVVIAGKNLQIWDLQQGKKIQEVPKQDSSFGECRFSPDGEYLVVETTIKGRLILWRMKTKKIERRIDLPFGRTIGFVFDSKRPLIYVVQQRYNRGLEVSGKISVYDVLRNKVTQSFDIATDGVAISSDGRLLALTEPENDHSVLFLNAKTLKPVHRISNVGFFPRDVHFMDNDQKLIVRANSTVELVDLAEVWRLLHKL